MDKSQELYERGQEFYSQGNIFAAKTCFREASQINPEHSEALNALATVLCDLNGGEWTEESIDILLRAIQADSKNFKALNNIGDYYYRRGEFDQAIEYFQNAVSNNPGYSDAFVNLALAYRNTQRSEDALVSLKNAITANPQSGWARYQLGLTFLYRGLRFGSAIDMEKAREIFYSMIELDLCEEDLPADKMIILVDNYLRVFINMRDLKRLLVEQTQYFGKKRDDEIFGFMVN